jgi:hypothetical protein
MVHFSVLSINTKAATNILTSHLFVDALMTTYKGPVKAIGASYPSQATINIH